MWEIIESNRRKSILLFFCMGAILIILGGAIGAYVTVSDDMASDIVPGVTVGVAIAIFIWIIWSIIAYFSADTIVLKSSGAVKVDKSVHPQLFNVVEEMKIAASLPAMPKVYIIPSQSVNAFATGRGPERSAIAVTAGLLANLDRDELQGVVAHEMSHILNRDVMFMTFSGVLLGSITLISRVFLRGSLHSSRRYRSSRNNSGGGAIAIIAIVAAIIAPILAQIFYFAISRKREYLADASAARLTRYPEGLASALEKISFGTVDKKMSNKILNPMYISDPEKKVAAFSFTSTHPPIDERIKVLRSMHTGASYADYQKAYSQVCVKSTPVIPASGLCKSETVNIREGSVKKPVPETPKQNMRKTGDIIRAVNDFVFLTCTCGLKLKIPPEFKKDHIDCPKCTRTLKVPVQGLAVATAVAAAKKMQKPQKTDVNIGQVYESTGTGWESFLCNKCRKLIQLSPMLSLSQVTCRKCGNVIEIKRNGK